MTIRLTGAALIKAYKRQCGGASILAFSGGKDSLATALAIRDHVEMIPMHYYLVPGLPMVEENLDYYERKLFKRRILRFPQFRLLDWLDTGVHQTMKHMQIIDAADFKKPAPNFQAYVKLLRQWTIEQEKLDPRTLTALGVRANDSPRRRMSFQQSGSLRPSTSSWFPVWNLNKDATLSLIEKSGIKLSRDYAMFGRSFDGLTAQYLIPIKKHHPEDWKIICEFFPLAPVTIWQYERVHGRT